MPDQATEAAFATAAATLAGDFIRGVVQQSGRIASTHILPHLKDFESYYSATYRKCDSVKIIIDRSQLHRLADVYVKGAYGIADQTLNDDGIVQLVRDNHRVLVQGLGGIGKTMLLKYVWLSIFREPAGRLPLFIELRRLNELKAPDLLSFIRRSLTPSGNALSAEQFHTLLKAGRFIFLFDAFDEVADEIRPVVERQILDLAHDYPLCGVLVSGRHDSRFGSWETFRVFQAQPFQQSQVEEVIDRVPFDAKVKAKFLNNVIRKKYETYGGFLSTPLLAIMMLITYEQFADIPEKVHIFYKYAFQTLYTLHDAGKETFRRDRKSGLTEDQFSRVFSIFCLASYLKRNFTFQRPKAVEEIQLAAKRGGVTVDARKFLTEVCESVNLMYEEGEQLTFTHRSFQEYFAAEALTTHLSSVFDQLAPKIPLNPDDGVFMMTYDMNRDLVEDMYLLPTWDFYAESIRKLIGGKLDTWDATDVLGLSMLVFPTRTVFSSEESQRTGTGVMTEFFCKSDFAEFVKRALAFLPETRAINWQDNTYYTNNSADIRKVVRKLGTEAGWNRRAFPDFAHVDLSGGLCEFEGDIEEDAVRVQYGLKKIRDVMTACGQAARVVEREISRQRGLLVTLDRSMKRVRARAKDNLASLEELLDERRNRD